MNLKQRWKKNKKIHQKIERERERTFFCEGKVCKKWQIFSKRLWIRKDKKEKKKKKKDKGKDEEWY